MGQWGCGSGALPALWEGRSWGHTETQEPQEVLAAPTPP